MCIPGWKEICTILNFALNSEKVKVTWLLLRESLCRHRLGISIDTDFRFQSVIELANWKGYYFS